MGTFIIGGEEVQTHLDVRNFREQGVHQFHGKRLKKITEVVVHESVTRSAKVTLKVLKKRQLGIHLVVTETGAIVQHADLLDRMSHAGPHNSAAVGIEVTNPYYPKYLNRRTPWKKVIDAPWADKGEYVVPLPEQAETLAQLVGWLSEADATHIPRIWRGFGDDHMAMGRVRNGKTRRPGIWAHTYWGHADGSWPVLYAMMRLELGIEQSRAYEWAIELATGAQGSADLSPVFAWINREPNEGPNFHD